MAVSHEQFVQQIVESGLLSAADLEAFAAALPAEKRPQDAEQLARALVRQKKLTAFQAQEIYAGRGRKLVLGNYVVLDKLGQGGMGMVLKAEHKRMHRQVALKVLSPAAVGSPDAVKRFQREVQAAAKLIHPNIVTAFDADEAGSTHFLVMEYVEGSDLSQLVKKSGPLALDKAIYCVLQAARGLEFAHKHGVVHRDIKPSNLLVDAEGTVKILDMGLARIESVGGDQAELTGTGQIMGTVDYMAPEQAMNTRKADQRADVYSLGITLWYLLAGKAAYEGETVMEKLMAHQRDPIPLLASVKDGVTPGLEAVFAKMVAKTPGERYQSMTEVIAALERCQSGGGVSPTATLGPSEDNKLSDFLKGVGNQPRTGPSGISSKSVAAASSSAPSPVVTAAAPSTADEFEQTIDSNPAQTDTDPQTQTNLHVASRVAGAGQSTAPWWRNPTTHIAAGAGGAGLLLCLILWFAFGGSAGDDTGGNEPPKAGWQGWPANAPQPAIVPFNEAQAKVHQRAWAEYLKLPVEYENSVGMKFVLIPPGEFVMGSTPAEIEQTLQVADQDAHRQASIRSEAPQHKVILSQPIYLGVHEVTQAEYERVMGHNPSYFAKTGPKPEWAQEVAGLNTSRHPVENVSWNDAAGFCIKLSEQERLTPFYSPSDVKVTITDASGYRLPTEAVWEFACRAGTTTRFWTGNQDSDLTQAAWFEANSDNRTHPVGELKANAFGLYDCHGNVCEWVNDCWEPTYFGQFQNKPALNPTGPTLAAAQRALGNVELEDVQRVLRGGEIMETASECRASARLVEDPYLRFFLFGFRVSLPVEAVKQAIAEKTAKSSSSTTDWQGWPADAPPPASAPFNATQAKQHQQAWADYLGLPVEKEIALPGGAKLTLVLIPPGEFLMGSTDDQRAKLMAEALGSNEQWIRDWIPSEGPQHRVRITQPFYLGKHEVTQAQWASLMGSNPAAFQEDASQPVEQVSWDDIQPFLAKLNADAAATGMKFVLPTEAQWEYACRAGTTTTWHCGESAETVPQYAWINANAAGKPHPVGQLQANGFGLHDMYGNVWERCADWQAMDYYAKSPVNDPPGAASGTHHVERGGSCLDGARVCRSASHFHGLPETRGNNHGFRVAAAIDIEELLTRKQTSQRLSENTPSPAIAPFTAAQAKQHQKEWAAYLKVPIEHENSVGMKFVLIPPGEFTMGSTPAEIEETLPVVGQVGSWADAVRSESPQHRVILTQPVYIGKHEVTQRQYARVVGNNPAHFAGMGAGAIHVKGLDTLDFPVETITIGDATDFCAALSALEKLEMSKDHSGYRLPTEAEWEFACRAGTTTRFWCGDRNEDLLQAEWHGANSNGRTHAVGTNKPNPFGIYDISGNVYEWVADDWSTTSYRERAAGVAVNPCTRVPGNSSVTVRRGSYQAQPTLCRSGGRGLWSRNGRSHDFGMRVVVSVDAVRSAIAKGPSKKAGLDDAVPATTPVAPPSPANAPFDEDEAKRNQAAWAKHLGVLVEMVNGAEMKMIVIPPGKFQMGRSASDAASLPRDKLPDDDLPAHAVTLTKPFAIAATEVTQKQWTEVMGTTPWAGKKQAVEDPDCPATYVSWKDATEFCKRLSTRESVTYRLPTEAEWEWACRAGTETTFNFGNNVNELRDHAWGRSNSQDLPHPVAQLPPNHWGLFDMHGNAWEWADDRYGPYSAEAAVDPRGPSLGDKRSLRGGCFWSVPAGDYRSAARRSWPEGLGYSESGFRPVRTLEIPTKAASPPTPKSFALEFDGIDDLVMLPAIEYDRQSPISFEAWVTPAISEKDVTEQTFRGVWANAGWLLQVSPWGWSHFRNGATPIQRGIVKGLRVHLVAQWDGSAPSMFVNGQRVPGEAKNDGRGAELPRHLGCVGDLYGNAHKGYFPGRIDEIRISKIARYAQDFDPPEWNDADADTLALYHCDEGDGNELKDSSSNGRHARIFGAKWVEVSRDKP